MMNHPADDRVPVHFGPPQAGDAVLVEAGMMVPSGHPAAHFTLAPGLAGHAAGCACCVPRGPVAEALGRLFLVRARGEVAWFGAVAVLATPAGAAAVRAALAADQ